MLMTITVMTALIALGVAMAAAVKHSARPQPLRVRVEDECRSATRRQRIR